MASSRASPLPTWEGREFRGAGGVALGSLVLPEGALTFSLPLQPPSGHRQDRRSLERPGDLGNAWPWLQVPSQQQGLLVGIPGLAGQGAWRALRLYLAYSAYLLPVGPLSSL